MADYQQFTVDLWVYPDGAAYGHIIGQHVTIVVGDWYLVEDSNGSFFFSCNNGSFTLRTAVAVNAWAHIAMVRNGNNYYLFLNGTLAQSTTWSGAIGNRKVVIIGADCNGNIPFQGYIDDVRISLGIARWTANFTPPARGSVSKDSYTKALLKFDESTTKDECGNTWTAYGSTAQKKFGTSSIYFEGTNYLQSTEGLILKANEKWFISLWNYKTTTSRYDTIMRKAGTRGDWFMFQTSDAYSSGNIGMRFSVKTYKCRF